MKSIAVTLSFAAIALLSTAVRADQNVTAEATPKARAQAAQNGGEVVQAAPQYAAGLNGRVKSVEQAPKARAQAAQNGGEMVQAAPQYAAGLNGRVKTDAAVAEESVVAPASKSISVAKN